MEYRSNSILAYIPPNDEGRQLLKQAMYFQQTLGMRIFVFNSIKTASVFTSCFNSKQIEKLKEAHKSELRNFFKSTLNQELPKILIPKVKVGNTLRSLIAETHHGGYEFIILDKSGSGNSLTRSETDKLINKAFCPVLSIDKDYKAGDIKKIIVPFDITHKTEKKLIWSSFFAKKLNASIQIVSALDNRYSFTESLAFRNSEKIKKMLTQRGIKCDIKILHVERPEKYNAIINYIQEGKTGMVIYRARQNTLFPSSEVLKYESAIVHDCKMPVFTVGRLKHPIPTDFEKEFTYTKI